MHLRYVVYLQVSSNIFPRIAKIRKIKYQIYTGKKLIGAQNTATLLVDRHKYTCFNFFSAQISDHVIIVLCYPCKILAYALQNIIEYHLIKFADVNYTLTRFVQEFITYATRIIFAFQRKIFAELSILISDFKALLFSIF